MKKKIPKGFAYKKKAPFDVDSEEYFNKLKTCRHCHRKIEPFGPSGCLSRPMVREGARSYSLGCEPLEHKKK